MSQTILYGLPKTGQISILELSVFLCGMYPIIGKRYKCKDCKEAIGYDLCEACYNTSSKLPGRFNQQHTPDHKFELDDSKLPCKILMLRAMTEVPSKMLEKMISLVMINKTKRIMINIPEGSQNGDEILPEP